MMLREIRYFFTALMFYTRIPVPQSTGFTSENLNRASRYLPLVGLIVGGTGALTFMAAHTVFSQPLSLLFSLGAMVLLTGAFHEDALSDFCDGFGGGYSKEQILTIMKDSRVGTYGVTGLVFLLVGKWMLLAELMPAQLPWVLMSAHAFSRMNAIVLIFCSTYVREDTSSKVKPNGEKHSPTTLVVALLIGMLPILWFSWPVAALQVFTAALLLAGFRRYVHKKIGGYTGDVLGTLQQLSEMAFYLTILLTNQLL